MFIFDFFKKIPSSISKLFTPNTLQSVVNVLEKVAPLVNQAYPYVVRVAELTGNRTTKEILKAYESYGIGELFNPRQPKNEAIRDLVKTLISKHTSSAGASNYLLNTAVELAYAQFRAEQEQAQQTEK